MLKNALKLAVAGTLVMATVTAVAAPSPATTTLNVSANVASNCLVTAAPLAFTDYDASGTVDGSADLSVRCSNVTLYTIKLGGGTHGNVTQRLLRSSGAERAGIQPVHRSHAQHGLGRHSRHQHRRRHRPGHVGQQGEHTHGVGTIANSDTNQDAPVGLYTDAVAVTVEY